jgi:hypothetical protein
VGRGALLGIAAAVGFAACFCGYLAAGAKVRVFLAASSVTPAGCGGIAVCSIAFALKLHPAGLHPCDDDVCEGVPPRAGRAAALAYAKRHFAPHAARHMQDIQRLMGCLLFSDRERKQQQQTSDCGAGSAPAPAPNPYADLMSPSCWDAAAREFAKQACSLMGQV